jgi:hypothetical protein
VWWIILPIASVLSLGFLSIRKRDPEAAFSEKNLEEYFPYRNWILAQAKHETANFTSNVYKQTNNLFGMKRASKRPQLGTDSLITEGNDGNPFRQYKSPGESVRDYVLYLRHFKVSTGYSRVDQFLTRLYRQGYWESSYKPYLEGVKRFLS